MALINKNRLNKLEKNTNSLHKEVEGTYSTYILNGSKYIQIDTYGSTERQYKGKISQSIQLDKDVAIKLIDILQKEFNL